MAFRTFFVVSVLVGAMAALGYAGWAAQSSDAAGVLTNRKIFVPGIAKDSSSTQPPSASSVVVSVRMIRQEPAFAGAGTTTINANADASGPLPVQSGPAVTASASLFIGTRPGDTCAWNIEVSSGNLELRYSRLSGSILRLNFDVASDISWYYLVQCPGSAKGIPFPAEPVKESFTGWLGLMLRGVGGPGGVAIDVPVVTDPSDVYFGRCHGELTNTNEWGTVTISILVTDASCKPPSPTPGPTPSPYDPGFP